MREVGNVDFRALQYIVAIAEHQNLTKAAEALYVGQPTLSKFLAGLEDELGMKLFWKAGHKYMLTYAGERYVARAAELLRLKRSLDAEMADILKREVGELRVAFPNMRCSYLLPAVLPAFQEKHPNVKVTLFEGNSDDNDRRLLEGQVELAFYSMPSEANPKIEYVPMAREELLICAPKGHSLASRAVPNPASPYPKLDLSCLKNERVLMMRPEQRTRQIMDAILRENHIQFDNVLYTSNIQAIMGLVSAGYGVSFVFDTHLRHRGDGLPLDCFSFGDPRTTSDFVAARRRGGYLSRYARAFIDTVRMSV